jgi:hypothetical protein
LLIYVKPDAARNALQDKLSRDCLSTATARHEDMLSEHPHRDPLPYPFPHLVLNTAPAVGSWRCCLDILQVAGSGSSRGSDLSPERRK